MKLSANRPLRSGHAARLIGVLLLGWLPTIASPAGTGHYAYPLKNPLAATIIGTPAAYRAQLPDRRGMRVREMSLTVDPDRDTPEVLWYAERLNYSLAYQRHKAPLIVIIAGTGGGHRGGKMDVLQKAFYRAGFHVLSLPSPTHGNFIASASSTGVPGYTPDDAADLYRVIRQAWADIKDRIEVSEFFLSGYSLGATQAAFVSKLDEEQKVFDFSKVLLINPPVSLYNSVAILDQMLETNIPGGLDNVEVWLAATFDAFSEVYRQGEFVGLTGEQFLYRAYQDRSPSDDQMAALIGFAFRISAANMVFVSDVFRNSGYIKPKNLVLTQATPLGEYARVAFRVSFLDYYRDLFLPFFQGRYPGLSEQDLIRATSLEAIEDYLRDSRKIGLMTNADEIILAPGELDYLRDLFGPRATIYPTGGHCGNMDYPENIDDMIRFFKVRGEQ